MDQAQTAATRALAAYPFADGATVRRAAGGLINDTFRVTTPGGTRYALQRLHRIFAGEVNLDIEAITTHLAAAGLATPRLVRTREGALWVELPGDDPDDPASNEAPAAQVWRMMTWIEGRTLHAVSEPGLARAAADLVGRFHRAAADCDHDFVFRRVAHGIPLHRGNLEAALAAHPDHRLTAEVAPLAEDLLAHARTLPDLSVLPRRITHGDLKISNILFAPSEDRALALIDLDTLGRLDLPTELGDAFRSWCNPAGEDGEPRFDLATFEAGIAGYAASARDLVTPAESTHLVGGTIAICVELAMRFAADALAESYFGWDSARFASRGDHNLHRARGQLGLARSLIAQRRAAEAIVHGAFA